MDTERYLEIGNRIARDNFDEVQPAIDEMVAFAAELKAAPLAEQRAFFLELAGMLGENPNDPEAELITNAISQAWSYYPRWDGAGVPEFDAKEITEAK